MRTFIKFSLGAVIVLLASLLPAVVSPMPHAKPHQQEQTNLDKKHLLRLWNRFSRETSESIETVTTPPPSIEALATTPTPSMEALVEGDGDDSAGTEEVRCNEGTEKVGKCKNLKEKLLEYFERTRFQLPLDTFFNSFVLEDLYHFGVVGEGIVLDDTQSNINFGEANCNRILQRYYKNISSGPCAYTHTCSYSSNTFPRFRVEAALNNPVLLDRQLCEEVRMEGVVSFRREKCPDDPCKDENWVEQEGHVVVGYVSTS